MYGDIMNLSKFTMIERGAMKLLYYNNKKVSGGHHSFRIAESGAIIGILGSREEIIMFPDGTFTYDNGSEMCEKEENAKLNGIINYLNARFR